MSAFVDTLFRTTINVPVESHSYALHLEVLNTLLSLLSIQMCAKEAVVISAIYSIFMYRLEYVLQFTSRRCVCVATSDRSSSLLISDFTRSLLQHFMQQAECPPFLAVESVSPANGDSGSLYKIGQSVASAYRFPPRGSCMIVSGIVGSLWSVMTFGMSSSSPAAAAATANDGGKLPEATNTLRNRHLSNQSIHLLLILSNHFTNDVHRNPYRLALLHFTDTQGKSHRVGAAHLCPSLRQILQQTYPTPNRCPGSRSTTGLSTLFSAKQRTPIRARFSCTCSFIVTSTSRHTSYREQTSIKL